MCVYLTERHCFYYFSLNWLTVDDVAFLFVILYCCLTKRGTPQREEISLFPLLV